MRELRLYKPGSKFSNVWGYDRFSFPEKIVRVSAGAGGEALMIFGSEKTAIIDCGMAYCAATLVENIHAALENAEEKTGKARTLDYIFATHTHYDHIGGVAAVKTAFPEATFCAGTYAASVFSRESAIRMIEFMSNNAARKYTGPDAKVVIEPEKMHVDRILSEGDRISLGEEEIVVLETPGHTNCSLSYVLEPDSYLFASESTGVVTGADVIEPQILKSYAQGRNSVEKCRDYHAKHVIIPHYGILPDGFQDELWEKALASINESYDFVVERKNLDYEQILKEYVEHFWSEDREQEQPFAAFYENAKNQVKAALRECGE